jgi:2,4-dienoyl-CoA reductase-like NADH-dependent reductase (Old Yellow Enzyme family)
MTTAADLPHLLSPVQLGPVSLRNRVVSTSHQTTLVHDHLPTADLLAYHEARARGGVGAIFLEATAVHSSGLLTAHTIGGFLPGIVDAYRRLGEPLRDHGARLFVQLFHGGREQISSAPRAPAVAPSAVPSLRFKSEPRALTVREIRDLTDGYARAATYAAEGGVDGLEVAMSHGYLHAQFLSRLTNQRRDEYSLDQRLRFPIEVLEAVRAASGDGLTVGVRLSADELVPGGLDPAATAQVAARFDESGLVDFVSLVLGHSAYPAASTWIAPPPPASADAIFEPAATVRAALRRERTALIAATRIVDLAAAERLVAGATADLVGMTRALIADPDLLAKTIDGRAEEVIECVGCNQSCIGHYHAGLPIGCAVNPRTGRERTLPRAARGSGRRVLVIGGGPAGVAAALEAAAGGDTVTLLERENELGGQLRLAGTAPAHEEVWTRYRRSTEARLRLARVTVELGVAAAAGDADDYDLVVLATGARPYAPPGVGAIQAWDAIRDPALVSGAALVADWGGGWDGLDAAERLAGAGRAVTLACAAPVPGETLHQYQRNLYLARLDEAGVEILHHHELVDGALSHVFSGRRRPLPGGVTLILAQGRVPADELWHALEDTPGVVRAGDVLGPRTLEEAVLEGTLAVRAESAQGAALGGGG